MNAREARMASFRQARERVQAMNAEERQRFGFDRAENCDEHDDEKGGAS